MITPRRTRLVRVPDLQTYRRAIASLCASVSAPEDTAVIVPTHASALMLGETIGSAAQSLFRPILVTRDELYDEFHRRLVAPPRRLTRFERDAIAQSAADAAAARVSDLPFSVRPGLVAELLRFYDQLRRQPQAVRRFEELITDTLGSGELEDRGAERLLLQTRFLADAFREYERRVAASGACDEHTLRNMLIAAPSHQPLRHVIVTVPDWIADPAGLFVADFELLATLPGLETLDLVCTSSLLGSGFHERLHAWWPGVEETDAAQFLPAAPVRRPYLARPKGAEDDQYWAVHRDREDELHAIARRISGSPEAWTRTAIVFKRPLPYLYLAPDTLGAAGVAYRVFDTLPLAAEPSIAPVDLVLEAVATTFSRESLVALASSPHLTVRDGDAPVTRASIAAMNKVLSGERYLGGVERLETLTAKSTDALEGPAMRGVLAFARELTPLLADAPASQQIARLSSFLNTHLRPLDSRDPLSARERKVRTRLFSLLADLEAAHAIHHDPAWTLEDLATTVRRWIGDQTIDPGVGATLGLALLDDQAARFGEFDDMTIVGVIENEWPERPRRNIFYPPGVLKALGWPSERDRRGADDARFLELIASAGRRVELSVFSLDDESLVSRAVQLDEVPSAKLSAVDAGAAEVPVRLPSQDEQVEAWQALRGSRTTAADPSFHGFVGCRTAQPWSVSALETYIGCPFKFYAQHVLKLEEEPDDEEIMDPRRQGQFVHQVFEDFFKAWQDAGHKAITPHNLPLARELFVSVVDGALTMLPEGEAALERTRLLGSSAAAGLGEAVFRMEAERPVPVVERLLEHALRGPFTINTTEGPRVVELRGKADRVDLLEDGTFRVIDYKLGWPPDRGRALQLPIYSVCAEQRLAGHRGRTWTLGEAVYLAFKGPKRVVPLFSTSDARREMLVAAQQRLAETIDAIERGEFPPSPDDVFRCETCSFQAVCRKDYVGDV